MISVTKPGERGHDAADADAVDALQNDPSTTCPQPMKMAEE